MAEQRLIDATPILQDFYKIADRLEGKNPYENVKIKAYRRCFERLADAPTIDAAPVVHGEWKFDDFDGDGKDYTCSICGWSCYSDSNYCPNCGAKMDEEVSK